ncbi:MAG TPA: type II toxin-antitoxin system VapC family toxin [Solirubrobacteraceae bacterium]|nr:type II toxin-antitoxin system VapC family toxin [Solirubrobacteraceae bacterium]
MSPSLARRERGLLDTSVVIELPDLADPAVLPLGGVISAVTLAELSVGPLVAGDDHQRAVRQRRLQEVEGQFDVLPFDAEAARAFGRVGASLRRAGRKAAARTYDGMIAAIAIANDLPLYTCNAKDFAGIEGLELIAVPTS